MKPIDVEAIRVRLVYRDDVVTSASARTLQLVEDELHGDGRLVAKHRGAHWVDATGKCGWHVEIDVAPELLALVDLQTRALLAVEWGLESECPSCGRHRQRTTAVPGTHVPKWCPLDAALTAAGLDTQEKRDAARKAMGGGR